MVTCQSCGSPVSRIHRFSRVAGCRGCGLLRIGENMEGLPTTSKLVQFPAILRVGKRLSLRLMVCRVVGRVRFRHEDVFYDEWFLSHARATRLVLSQQGDRSLLMSSGRIIDVVPDFSEIRRSLSLGDMSIEIVEKGSFTVVGIDGQLPRAALVGEQGHYALGNWREKPVLVRWWNGEVTLQIGEEIPSREMVIAEH